MTDELAELLRLAEPFRELTQRHDADGNGSRPPCSEHRSCSSRSIAQQLIFQLDQKARVVQQHRSAALTVLPTGAFTLVRLKYLEQFPSGERRTLGKQAANDARVTVNSAAFFPLFC